MYRLRRVGGADWGAASNGGSAKVTVVGEVRARENGTNELVLRSPVRFYNATETPIEVRVHTPPAAFAAPERPAFARDAQSSPTSRKHAPKNAPKFRDSAVEERDSEASRLREGIRSAKGCTLVLPQETWAVPLTLLADLVSLRGGVSLRPRRDKYERSDKRTLAELALGPCFLGCEAGEKSRATFYVSAYATPTAPPRVGTGDGRPRRVPGGSPAGPRRVPGGSPASPRRVPTATPRQRASDAVPPSRASRLLGGGVRRVEQEASWLATARAAR